MDHTSIVEPELVCAHEVESDVTDLLFLDEERITASFSNGCVALLKYKHTKVSMGF